MKKCLKLLTTLFVLLTIVTFLLTLKVKNAILTSIAITSFTFSYHFLMRLAVGYFYDKLINNNIDYQKGWFQCRAWERTLYKAFKVKTWKSYLPTYDSELFNPANKSWDEIAKASAQAELVHETIAVLSFIPLFFALPFGSFEIFLLTSILASFIDLSFVIVQRYNRDRILKVLKRG